MIDSIFKSANTINTINTLINLTEQSYYYSTILLKLGLTEKQILLLLLFI